MGAMAGMGTMGAMGGMSASVNPLTTMSFISGGSSSSTAQASAATMTPAMMAMMGMGTAAQNQLGPSGRPKTHYTTGVCPCGAAAHPNIFIGNLPRHLTEVDLMSMFGQIGSIVFCK